MAASYARARSFLVFIIIFCTTPTLLHASAGLSPIALKNDTDAAVAADPQYSEDGSCSTKIVLAVYFKSRYCKNGTVIVAATSNFKSEANLELLGYGPMKWNKKSQMWLIKVVNVEESPGIATLDGTECATSAEVVTVPFGCDARIQADMTDDP
jgi:hypothetical protein